MAVRKNFFQQAIVRVGLILFSALVIFAFARQLAIPSSFGEYGRYRGDAVSEAASLETSFASGNNICNKCHQKEIGMLSLGEHTSMDCQSCHGPSAKHFKDPLASSPKITEVVELCSTCHRKIAGRLDENIATVEPQMHSGGVACNRCHEPHQPWVKLGGRKP